MFDMRFVNSNLYKVIFVTALLVLQTNFAIAARTLSASDLYFLAQKSFYQLKAAPKKQKFRHNWIKTIKLFSKVVDRYPKSNEAYRAEFTIGKLYDGLNAVSKNPKDLDRAAQYYNNVSEQYSPANLSDDALFRMAEIYFAKRDFASASATFKEIFEKYPKGDLANIARQKYKNINIALKNKIYEKVAIVAKPKSPKPVAITRQDSKLKRATSIASTEDKKKIIAEFKQKTHKTILKKINQPNIDKLSSKALVKKKFSQPAVKVRTTRKAPVKKKVLQTPIRSAKKEVKVKDGFGRGYLYNPKIPKRKQGDIPLIVVDAGHGGKDHGARSASGIKEKDVNIKIAKHVKTILVNRFKYRVVMTRKDDTFIPLKDRSKISNKRNADLFVSIHANAAKRKSAHGIETYFLGTSHNERALETAARENGELVKSVKDNQVQQILASLITTTKINDSSRLAGRVQDNLYKSSKKKYRGLKNLGVKEGPFYVLHGADMPSILVEVGFLTHRKEARMLSQPKYIYRLASSIAEGIHKYLQDKGPSI
jgi:N-acetylmuramoyl-L-alanine amidase